MGNPKGVGFFKPGHQYSKGHGRPALPPALRAERKKNQAALIRLVARHFALTEEQANQRRGDPEITRCEEAVMALIDKSIKDGDVNAFKFLIEIMCGKIPEEAPEQYTDEEIRILNRAKELIEQERSKTIVVNGSDSENSSNGDSSGHD